jgi:hypothetical protein
MTLQGMHENTPQDFNDDENYQDPKNLRVSQAPFADKVAVDETQIREAPMGGSLASAGPLNAPMPAGVKLFETPDQEIPMGGTLAAVGPLPISPSHPA